MRAPTLAVALLCLALPAAAQNPPRQPEPPPRPIAEPAREPAPAAAAEDRGFWSWLRSKDESRPRERLEMPERVERPDRIERPDRPERASGGCCQ